MASHWENACLQVLNYAAFPTPRFLFVDGKDTRMVIVRVVAIAGLAEESLANSPKGRGSPDYMCIFAGIIMIAS